MYCQGIKPHLTSRVNPWATKLFCDIGYQGVGGYHPPLNFVIIL